MRSGSHEVTERSQEHHPVYPKLLSCLPELSFKEYKMRREKIHCISPQGSSSRKMFRPLENFNSGGFHWKSNLHPTK